MPSHNLKNILTRRVLPPLGFPKLLHSGKNIYFLNVRVWLKMVGGKLSNDHWRKISPSFGMYLTPNQGRRPSFLSPIN
jgi:hypothetical protein